MTKKRKIKKSEDVILNLKDKKYSAEVNLSFTQFIDATSKDAAMRKLKQSFFDEYGIELGNKEIKLTRDK